MCISNNTLHIFWNKLILEGKQYLKLLKLQNILGVIVLNINSNAELCKKITLQYFKNIIVINFYIVKIHFANVSTCKPCIFAWITQSCGNCVSYNYNLFSFPYNYITYIIIILYFKIYDLQNKLKW